MSIEPVDVMIVGGGMVGASLAVALSSLPLKIALVESFPFQLTQQPGYDDRAIALSYGSSQILQGMGIWNEVSAVANPIDSIHVSDRGHFGATRLNAKQHNVPALGYLVEAQVYSQVLHTYLEQREVRLIQPAHIQNIEPADHGVIVSIDCEGVITKWQSRLLVACDGANSTVREMVGVSATTKDYGQTAIIANVTTEVPHNNQAFERFTESGPIALLPMSGNRCSLVWTVNTGDDTAVLELTDNDFLDALGDAFGYRLGRFTRVGRRSAFALRLTQSSQLTADRVAMIGNAAHALHPVAGQGLNLALRDVAELAEQVASAIENDEDIGSLGVLNAYASLRKKDTARTIQYTDSLVTLFSNDGFLLGHARALGLSLVDRLSPLRRVLAKQSMGLASCSSRLSRGLPLKESV